MGLFDNFKKAEVRSLENPNAPVSAENFLHIMGWGDFQSTAGVTVNIDNALGVPAVDMDTTRNLAPDSILAGSPSIPDIPFGAAFLRYVQIEAISSNIVEVTSFNKAV